MLWNRFGRVCFAVVPLIGFSLFCFSSNVPVYVVREGFLSAVGTDRGLMGMLASNEADVLSNDRKRFR